MSFKNVITFSFELLVYNVCYVLERNTYSEMIACKCTIQNPTLVQQRVTPFFQTSLISVKVHIPSWDPLKMIARKCEVQKFYSKTG